MLVARAHLASAIGVGAWLFAAGCVTQPEPEYGLPATVLTFAATDSAGASEYFNLKNSVTTVRLISLTDATGRELTANVSAGLVNEDGGTLTTRALSGLSILGTPVLPPTILLAGFSLRTDTPFVFEFDELTEWGLGEGQAQLRLYLRPWELFGAQPPLTAIVEVENGD